MLMRLPPTPWTALIAARLSAQAGAGAVRQVQALEQLAASRNDVARHRLLLQVEAELRAPEHGRKGAYVNLLA
jgi:hypothetical protein